MTKYPRKHFANLARKEGVWRPTSNRPEWWRRMPKPILIIGHTPDQVGVFCHAWRIKLKDRIELKDVRQFQDLEQEGLVLFVLPFGTGLSQPSYIQVFIDECELMDGIVVRVPHAVLMGRAWPDELSMEISTRLAIARTRK